MGYGIRIRVWGDYALFTRPELKSERCSYDVMTPSAARGILEAIYWHPGMKWIIDKIYVCKPISFTNIRRNEVKEKISADNVLSTMNGSDGNLYINASKERTQRAAMILKDVEYVIEAHFEMTKKKNPDDNPSKFIGITTERAEKGQCFHNPYLGCREFPANFTLVDENTEIETAYNNETKELGFMLYDIDYEDDYNPMFFRAVMENGVIDLRNCEVLK